MASAPTTVDHVRPPGRTWEFIKRLRRGDEVAHLITLLAAASGLFDDMPAEAIVQASAKIRELLPAEMPDLYVLVESGGKLGDADRQNLIALAGKAVDAAWKRSKP